jgi:hypothetical protein
LPLCAIILLGLAESLVLGRTHELLGQGAFGRPRSSMPHILNEVRQVAIALCHIEKILVIIEEILTPSGILEYIPCRCVVIGAALLVSCLAVGCKCFP